MPGGTSTHMRDRQSITKRETMAAPAARPPLLLRIQSRAMTIANIPIRMVILMLPPSSGEGQSTRRQIHLLYLRCDLLHEFVLDDLGILVQGGASPRDGSRLALRFGHDRL